MQWYGRAALVLLAGALALPSAFSTAQADAGKVNKGTYLVQMAEPPVVAYAGGVKDYKATKPARGQKIDPNDPQVALYASYLDMRHDDALAAVGGGQKLYDYRYTYNGFAAQLSDEQAAKMAGVPGVLAVSPDEIHRVDTSSTPAFLGLSDAGGLWDQLGGVGSAGDGVIIGVIDTGIWPESLSFSDRTGVNGNASKDGKLNYQQIPGWHGKCVPGEAFNASMCNQKLIGAQWFNQAFGGDAGVDATLPWEFNSARDYGGHGTHTASTAGGNNGVPATGLTAAFGAISGIAPHARIAMYKALWEVAPGQGSGYNSDLVAAIDQAVADGVDVINYSISGTSTNFRDPVEISFMYAAAAGIFVAESAGNSGPTTSTVAHPGPWTTTVAAGTHNRAVQGGSVTLGNNVTYSGTGNVTPIGPLPLVDGATSGLAGADAGLLALCYGASDDGKGRLDPAKVAGKIVVCNRGGNVLVNKAQAVKDAGGLGMVLVNTPTSANTTPFVSYAIPAVHLANTAYQPVKDYAATAGAIATINGADIVFNAPAPFTASFSSRGPLLASGDLLKPDLMAPGQDILAAVAPPGNSGRDFDLYSGTSMSSPHVAGLAALLKQQHPDWTPMMIKSALMTTGYNVLDAGISEATRIFRQGAGHVKPNNAADPGLVYNSGWNDWLAFICATQPQGLDTTCNALWGLGYSKDPSDFNSPSIAIADLAGVQAVKRKVTSVGGKETYTFSYSGLAGITAVPSVSSFTINPGASQSYSVTFTNDTAAPNLYVGGYIAWTGDKGHLVRIPVVIRPVALAAPAAVSGTGGAISYKVTFGYSGAFTAAARGLVPAALTAGTVADDPTDGSCSLTSPNAQLILVAVPAGTTYVRFSLFDADVNPGSDIDLCVFNSAKALVGSSGSGTSAEEVNLLSPAADTYTVVVQGWGVVGSSPFKLHTWLLGTADAGNMTVSAPAAATVGGTGTVNLTFSGLTAGTKYLGSVVYGGAAGMPNPTIVRVDP